MKIQVLHRYDSLQYINARDLKRLIAQREILAFRRADGWAKVGIDPVRGDGGRDYDGPERRNVMQKPLEAADLRAGHYCVIGVRGEPADW